MDVSTGGVQIDNCTENGRRACKGVQWLAFAKMSRSADGLLLGSKHGALTSNTVAADQRPAA